MNNQFSFARLGQLMKYEFNLNSLRNTAFFGLGAALILTVWFFAFIFGASSVETPFRIVSVYFGVLLSMIITPSVLYGHINIPRKGISYAMLPATKSEKFFSMLLNTLVVYPVGNFVLAIAFDCLLTLLGNMSFGPFVEYFWEGLDVYAVSSEVVIPILLLLLVILTQLGFYHALYFFCNTLFKKVKFLLSFAVQYGLQIIFTIGIFVVMAIGSFNNDSWVWAWYNSLGTNAETTFNIIFGSLSAFYLILSIGLYIWSWIRFKKVKY